MNGLQIKTDVQGLLIYATAAAFALAMLAAIRATVGAGLDEANRKKRSRLAVSAFGLASVIAIVSVTWRGVHVNHLPLQNMFEVFLFLGACIGPMHWLSGRILGRWHPVFATIDAVIALIVLFPAGFVFSSEPQHLPPPLQSWLFGPHVAAYMLAYIFMAKAAVFAAAATSVPGRSPAIGVLSDFTYRLVVPGFVLLTGGLFLGSVWGKLAWGDWWGWDPKELWSLAGWLVYGIYFHARLAWPRLQRLHNALVLLGLLVIVITLLWVNLSQRFPGLHNYAV